MDLVSFRLPSSRDSNQRECHESPTASVYSYLLPVSILADHFDEKPSRSEIRHGNCECWGPHQEFKWAYIASKPQYKDFEITSSEIEAWLEDYYSTAKTDDWLEMAYEDANGCGRED